MTGWRHGLRRVAEGAVPACRAAGDQLPFLRQRGGAICRDRRARRPARAGAPHGRGLRRAARDHRRGAERPARASAAPQPGGAFYTFPNIAGTGFDARTLQSELLDKAGVATIAGTSFGAFGEGYLRFSYANSLEAISEAIERIRQFLGNRRRAATRQRADKFRHFCRNMRQIGPVSAASSAGRRGCGAGMGYASASAPRRRARQERELR